MTVNTRICGLRALFMLVPLLLGLIAVTPALAGESRLVEIRVARNDTLIGLCQRYLQHPEQWQVIARLNGLAQPDLLAPGQKIVVPVEMLKGVPLQARVTFLKGTGFLKEPGSAVWNPLHRGEAIPVGSSLKSGPASSVEVSFADGTLFLLRENTALTVKEARQGVLHLLRVLYLEAGKVITRVKAATGRDSRFEIETPSALAAARGTEYRVGVDEAGTTRAEMLERSIAFSAMGSTIALNQDEGSFARFREPPQAARKLLPPPEPAGLEPSYRETPLTLRFSPVAGAARYRAVLARDREGMDTVKEALILPGEALEVAPESDGSYYVIASSIDSEGLEGRLSHPRELVLHREGKKPEAPEIPAPEIRVPRDAARLRTTRLAITWQKVPGATRYQLQIADDPGFSRLVTDEKDLAGTAYSTGALTTGDYYLRLRGREEDGAPGKWSSVCGFSVLQMPAPALRKVKSSGKGWDFAWDPPEEGISSQIQLAGDPEFSRVILERTLAEPELHLDTPLGPGTYYLRVRGVDASQHAGSYSEVASFVIEKPPRFPYELLGVGAVLLMILL